MCKLSVNKFFKSEFSKIKSSKKTKLLKIKRALSIILFTCIFLTSKQILSSPNNLQDEILKNLPAVGTILKVKENIEKEIKTMTNDSIKELINFASEIEKGKFPDENLLATINFLRYLNFKIPTIIKHINNILNELNRLEQSLILKIAGNVLQITPKVKISVENIRKTLVNLQDASQIILKDINQPLSQAYKLLESVRSTGIYDILGIEAIKMDVIRKNR